MGVFKDSGYTIRMKKSDVIQVIRDTLTQELAAQQKIATAARDEATGEESKPENQYDTRSVEASYLAGALSERILALRRLCAFFNSFSPPPFGEDDAIAVGALVELEEEEADRRWWCLMVPQGGRTVTVKGTAVTLLSPAAPMGQALAGAVLEEAIEFDSPRGIRTIEVIGIR